MKFFNPKRRMKVVRERRLDQRKPSQLQAAVCWNPQHSQQCRITSMSLTGLFLELQESRITIGEVLQLFFYSDIDGSRKLCCEWVRVEGQRNNGVAVSFARFDNQHQCNIQLMLQEAMVHPASLTNVGGAPEAITKTA
jgi:hypothetical protein